MSPDQVRSLLLRKVKPYATHRGFGLRAWCAEHDVAPSHASDFISGNRGPNSDLLKALGLEWQIVRKPRTAVMSSEGKTMMNEMVARALAVAHSDLNSEGWQDFVGDARAAIAAMRKELEAAVEKQPWCPCCGYDGLWPRGQDGDREWKEFLDDTLSGVGQRPLKEK